MHNYIHNHHACMYSAYIHASMCGLVSVLVYVDMQTCMPFSLCWFAFACIIVTRKVVVTVSSLQLSAVVLPPKHLEMVIELSLVQLLDPQWPTPVTEGTTCKEPEDDPVWLMESGVGGHQFAVVCWYCMQSDHTTFSYNGYLNHIAQFGGQMCLNFLLTSD